MIGYHTYRLYRSPYGLGYLRQFAPRHRATASPVLPLEVLVDLAAYGMEFSVNDAVAVRIPKVIAPASPYRLHHIPRLIHCKMNVELLLETGLQTATGLF